MGTHLEDRKAAVIARHGPWIGFNIRLGDDVYTIAPGAAGVADSRVARVLRAARDAARRPLDELRVLDLGCHEGGFAVAFAREGAEVLAVDARESHVAKTRFAAETLALNRLTVELADVRSLDAGRVGRFDVVLCLGVLYHLDAPACFELMQAVHDLCADSGLTVVETQIALSRPRTETWRGRRYRGRTCPEDTRELGASYENPESFWMTRSSLINLTADVGFSTVVELLFPLIGGVDNFRDHVTLLAHRSTGTPATDDGRWPESRGLPIAHPTQGLRYRLVQRLLAVRGRGMEAVFPTRPDQ